MTDVPVNRLNNRLARYLPTELPLGLVFVIGHVENLRQEVDVVQGQEDAYRTWFDLVEMGHRIRCQLSERAASEFELNEGERIRAGGHLAFDRHRADYYLLARDIELVVDTPVSETIERSGGQNGAYKPIGRQALTPILADIKRRAESTNLEQAQLPYWVQRLAPAEVKEELAQLEPAPAEKPDSETKPTLDKKLVAALSQAMDSSDEVELTSDLLGNLGPTAVSPQPPPVSQSTGTPSTKKTPDSGQMTSRQTVVLLLVVLLLLVLITAVFILSSLS